MRDDVNGNVYAFIAAMTLLAIVGLICESRIKSKIDAPVNVAAPHKYLPPGAVIRTAQIHNGTAYFVWRDAAGDDHELTIPEGDVHLVLQPGD